MATCLRAIAATCDILKEAEKFTLGQPTMAFVPHWVLTLLEQKGGNWLKEGNIGKYQAIVLGNLYVTFQTITTLNLATSLPDLEGNSDLQHDCLEIIDKVYSSRPDLLYKQLADPNWKLYESNFMEIVNDEPCTQWSP